MPLIEHPLYSCLPVGPEAGNEHREADGPKQLELF
jgi:hypothetical protein